MSKDKRHETVADIVAEMRVVAREHGFEDSDWADRIEEANRREDALWRAALAKVSSVVTRHYARSNLGEQGHRAVAEIMSACRFPDGALDEYARSFAERDRLRAALKPVLDCDCQLDDYQTKDEYMAALETSVSETQRIYNEGETK